MELISDLKYLELLAYCPATDLSMKEGGRNFYRYKTFLP